MSRSCHWGYNTICKIYSKSRYGQGLAIGDTIQCAMYCQGPIIGDTTQYEMYC